MADKLEPAYKRKMRIDEKETRGEALSDFEVEERERLKKQILAENAATDQQAKSTDDLRAKYRQMKDAPSPAGDEDDPNADKSQKAMASIRRAFK
jgi:hypothetical protein